MPLNRLSNVGLRRLSIQAHLRNNDLYQRFNHGEGVKMKILINMA